MNLSVCMIVKNEEEYLQQCLDALPAACEVIVVDTGSTDRTIEIAKTYSNVRLFHYTWSDNFSDARNYSIMQATGSHIFILDADEQFGELTYAEIEHFVSDNPRHSAAIMIRNHDDGSDQCSIHRMVRLFPNRESLRFHGAVHEVLYDRGQVASFLMSNITIDHYGYNQSNYVEKKYSNYLKLYENQLRLDSTDGYMWYQLGKLHTAADKYEEACNAFLNAEEFMHQPSLSHAAMIIAFAKTLRSISLFEVAIELLENKKQLYSDYPDLFFQLGLLYMDTGAMGQIKSSFEKAMRIGDTTKYATTHGVGSFLSAYNLGVYFEVTNNKQQAIKYYKIAAAEYPPAKERLMLCK